MYGETKLCVRENVAEEISESDLREIQRLRFVLDKANRFPNLLSGNETLKLSRKLADLERKVHRDKKQ